MHTDTETETHKQRYMQHIHLNREQNTEDTHTEQTENNAQPQHRTTHRRFAHI